MSGRNKFDVKVGQVWLDNDTRISVGRRFEVTEVDADYYPHGRAVCRLLGPLKHGQRGVFNARLDRFNGNQRGYSLIAESVEAAAKAKDPEKASKKKAPTKKKKTAKKAAGAR